MHKFPIEEEFNEIKNRREIIIILLVILIGFPIACLYFVSFIGNYQVKKELTAYQPIIDEIIEYKNIHNVYPDTIRSVKTKSKKFPYYKYETYNNNEDFVFLVSTYKYNPRIPYNGNYRYCSNKDLIGCNPELSDRFVEYYTVGNWVETYYND